MERLLPTEFTRATLGATAYDPVTAARAGYLDRAVPADDVLDVAMAEARTLGEYRTGAYSRSKQQARGAFCGRIRASLAEDIATLTGPDPAT